MEQRPGNSNHCEIIPRGRKALVCRLTHFAPSERSGFLQGPRIRLSCQLSEAHITISLRGFATALLSVGFSMIRCSRTKVMAVESVL